MLPRRLLTRALLRQRHGRSVQQLRPASTNNFILSSQCPDVTLPDITMHERIFQKLSQWEDRISVEDSISDRKYNYGQLRDLSHRVGAGFLKSGLKQGQVVALVLPNIPEFIIATLGAFSAGLVVTAINPLYGPAEILHQVADSDTALIITYPQKVAEIKAAISQLKGPPPPIGVIHPLSESPPEGTRSFLELFSTTDTSALEKIKVNPNDLALLLYSSGTTGLPKGVRLTHRNVISNSVQMDREEFMPGKETTKDHQEVAACVLPFFHVYGLVIGAFCYLARGAKLITLPRFEKDLYLKALTVHKASIAHVVPPIAQFLAQHPEVTPSTLDSLRFLTNGAAALSQTDGNRLLEKKSSLTISSGYGLTESSPVITGPHAGIGVTDLDSVGYIIPSTKLKILDCDTGEIQDPTKPGEICAIGPQIMDGYHKNPEATASTIIDGWLHTGDVGFVKDGRLFIVDRLKELIKVKGFQVAPMELEELLRSHPGVADAGVVGKPDPRLGETPVAFVVPNSKKPSAQELKDFVASKLAEYKQISEIIFVDAIPKNLTGKILRRQLKEKLPKS